MIPVRRGHQAHVNSASEFSASTVATTISLATVVLAFFELAPYLGLWLLWTVVTTAMGILVVRIAAHKIENKLKEYQERIPTLHEFLSTEFSNPSLALVAASCTSLGFLGALAVELTVGSRFFAWLVPGVSPLLVIIILAAVILTYTSAGGFRVVIVTDVIQMIFIRIFLITLIAYYVYHIWTVGNGFQEHWSKVPHDIWNFSWREGLTAFLIGIFIINVPTFISDMSMWQRITSTKEAHNTFTGLSKSIIGAASSWTGFAIISCFVSMIVTVVTDQNPLRTLLTYLGNTYSPIELGVLFIAVLGLYGAMLSTGSTQLIAVSHTIYEDIAGPRRIRNPFERAESRGELIVSRAILIATAGVAIVVVEFLSYVGFSIADLVFAIYGAQLGLFPPVLLALLLTRVRLRKLGRWAMVAIALGFAGGWSAAVVGKLIKSGNLVFLAPAVSLLMSGITIGIGMLATRKVVREVTHAT